MRSDLLQNLLGFFQACSIWHQAETPGNAKDMRVHGHEGQAKGEEENYGSSLWTDAGN